MLKLDNICKTFNPGTINEKKALQNLSLTLKPGDFVTVIGGNGAGKSTMLNAIAGVWPVDSGSITIDGISLTVAAVDGEGFSVSTIPHTVAQTNLSQRRQGDPVNLETDVVGKYIEKLLRPEETKPHTPANESTLTKEMLLRCGF